LFKAVYSNASKMKYVAQAIAKIIDEAPFYATPDALEVKVLSPDKTMLTIVKIPSIAFDEYNVDGEEFFVVSSMDFNRIIRRCTRNDVMEMELDKERSVLKIVFRDKKTGIERTFLLETRPRPPEQIPEINIELGVTVKMASDDYRELLGDLKTVGETAVFMVQEGKLVVRTGEQQKEYEGVFSEGNPLIYLSSTAPRVQAKYSIDQLQATLKPISAAKQVTLYFDSDKPLKIEYEIAGGGTIVYWLTPRAE